MQYYWPMQNNIELPQHALVALLDKCGATIETTNHSMARGHCPKCGGEDRVHLSGCPEEISLRDNSERRIQ